MEQNVMCIIIMGAYTRRQKLNQLPYRLAGVYNFSRTSVQFDNLVALSEILQKANSRPTSNIVIPAAMKIK